MARREADLATAYKAWKKLLGKCNACHVKVLRSLAEDDCREAADTLGEKARPPVPNRCGHCPGCLTFQSEKACKLCPGCQTNQGCEERTRLCFDWPRVSNYFQLGSTVTGVSTGFDLASSDLTKYRDKVELLVDASADLDLVMARYPVDVSYPALHPIFCLERRQKEINDEETMFSKTEALLEQHREHRARLEEVAGDDPTDREVVNHESSGDFHGWSPKGPGAQVLTNTQKLNLLPLPTHWTEGGSTGDFPHQVDSFNQSPPRLGGRHEQLVSDGPSTQPFKPLPRTVFRLPDPPQLSPNLRRRSQTGPSRSPPPHQVQAAQDQEEMRERLYQLTSRINARSEMMVSRLTQLQTASNPDSSDSTQPVDWIDREVLQLQERLDQLEEMEAETWTLTLRLQGPQHRAKRASLWQKWYRGMQTALTQVQNESWTRQKNSRPSPAQPMPVHKRTGGHVEKVRLPVFNGQIEEYASFKAQFRQLCEGEGYSGVLELAQLRSKLPRDAQGTILGLMDPEEAWTRLDEVYGNREMSIVAALSCLQNHKTSKHQPHDQILELAAAVQVCWTVLKSLEAETEMFQDREVMSFLVDSLPGAAQGRWYDRSVPGGETRVEKGQAFLKWLERERVHAVTIHLDCMTSKLQKPPNPSSKPPASTQVAPVPPSTDLGLYSSVHHATQPKPVDPGPRPPVTPDAGPRAPVTTVQGAAEATAKRKSNLEAKGQDKCPLCQAQHTFEKTWSSVTPATKTKMLSTFLSSCPKFQALSPDQKRSTCVAQAACLVCTGWDHPRHRQLGGRETSEPKCKLKVAGVECGGSHGRWFHETPIGTGTSSFVQACKERPPAPSHGPCLYEVYQVAAYGAGPAPCKGTIFMDPGSDTDFIREGFARSLGLTGTPVTRFLKVVGEDYCPVQTVQYEFQLQDIQGQRHSIVAWGLESVTSLPPDPDLAPLLPLLQEYPRAMLQRPQGEVDVLLGLPNLKLHGRCHREWGDLRVLSSSFGCGWAVQGSQPELRHPGPNLAPALSMAALSVCRAVSAPQSDFHVFHVASLLPPAEEFHELQELGTTPASHLCQVCWLQRMHIPEEAPLARGPGCSGHDRAVHGHRRADWYHHVRLPVETLCRSPQGQ